VCLAIVYAALFAAAGAVLLALTYGLAAASLPTTSPHAKLDQTQQAQLTFECKEAARSGTGPGGGKLPPGPQPVACQKLETLAANAATAAQRDQTLHYLLIFSLLGLAVMTVASGGLGWLMAGRVLRPVSALTAAARRASERHLGERLGLEGPRDELKELADTFDEMLDRLDVAFSSQRRFIADASHELRTPLTVMRTAIDVTLAKPDRSAHQLEAMAAKVRRSVDQADKLIDALLTLAVSDHELPAAEHIDLATVAEDAVDIASPQISQRGLQVDSRLDPAGTHGARSLLERLVGNLVDNAVRHNLPDGWIDLRTGTTGDMAYMEVSNSGPIIDEGLVPSLFEPFRRIEERTSNADGVGLGLAIVRSIATAHRGTLTAHSLPNGGLKITVRLPSDGASTPPA
jgi:signal transduction histidine kinase